MLHKGGETSTIATNKDFTGDPPKLTRYAVGTPMITENSGKNANIKTVKKRFVIESSLKIQCMFQ